MIAYQTNNTTLRGERDLAEILSVFNSDYVFDVVKSHIGRRYNYNIISNPNAVNVFKANFDNIRKDFAMDSNNIAVKEEETYLYIISLICDTCKVEFDTDTEDNIYVLASTIYDFLVTGYSKYMINFLTNMIIHDTENIYQQLNLEEEKKNKDSGTIYSKKTISNDKLAIINANLYNVLKYISTLDIHMDDILDVTYNEPIKIMILNNFQEKESIFGSYMNDVLSDESLTADVITNIRLQLQQQ